MSSADPEDRLRAHSRSQQEYFQKAVHTLKRKDSPYLRRHVDRMMAYAGIKPGDRVLEVGCGLGRYTLILAEYGVRVEGLDLTSELIDTLAAEIKGHYDIPLHACDVIDCGPEMSGAFDAVIGFFVLHHVHDLDTTFAAVQRLVRPGGMVAFIEPNPINPLYYLQITFMPDMSWHGEKGIFKMRRKLIGASMARAGLQDTSRQTFGFFPPPVTNAPGGVALESFFERIPIWRPALPFQVFAGVRAPAGAETPHDAR